MSLFSQAGGFRACRNLASSPAILKTFAVSASNNEAYFIGDAVILGTSGRIKPLKAATTTAPLGVIASLARDSGGRPMPLTLQSGGVGPYLVSGQAGYAQVNVDPNQTYVVEFDGNFTEAVIGATVKVSAGAPNTRAGLSGQRLGATVAVSSDSQFQIIGAAPIEMTQTRTSAAGVALLEVKMVRSIFNGNPV